MAKELTLEEAKKMIEGLNTKIEGLNNKIAELTGKAGEAKTTIADLGKKLAAAEKEVASKTKTAESALKKVAEMGKKLDILEKGKGGNFTLVTVDGVEYKLLGNRFFTKKGELTAEQLAGHAELLSEMVAKNSGSLVPAEQDTTDYRVND